MSDTGLWQSVVAFVRENEVTIELVVFFLGFMESLVFVSFFVPASVLFLAFAALQSASEGPFLPILLAGALGLPVFAGGLAGLGRILGPTGGYLIGFLPAVYIV